MLNVELLRKAVHWAEAENARLDQDESEWDQGHWFIKGEEVERSCGTAMCIAGKIVFDTQGLEAYTNRGQSIPYAAADELGVDIEEVWNDRHSGSLFSWANTIDDVRQHATELAEKYGEKL